MSPSVVVVMRTKGSPLLLERGIRSVAAQSYDDYELIVVNDGGDRGVVDGLLRRHAPTRSRAIHHAEHVGLYSPPNAAIRESDSTFVAIHDDDDTWDPAFLAETTRHLLDTGAMGVVATADKVTERIEDDHITTLEQARLYPELRFLNLYELCFVNYATPIAFLYRREAYEEIDGYDESLETVGDWDFAIRFLLRFEIEFLQTAQPLAFYRHRPDAPDTERNVVHTDRHKRLENVIANRYLRADIASGKPGIGFVMNTLRHEYTSGDARFAKYKEATDEQVRYLAACIGKVETAVLELQEAVTPAERLKSDLRFLRSLPRRVARRLGA